MSFADARSTRIDEAVIGPLTFGQGGLGGINIYGQTTDVQSGSYVSLGVYPRAELVHHAIYEV